MRNHFKNWTKANNLRLFGKFTNLSSCKLTRGPSDIEKTALN